MKVQLSDSLPDSVCKICENSITQFYVFRENCLNAHYTLLHRASFYNTDDQFNYLAKQRDASLANFATSPNDFNDNTDNECARLESTELEESHLDSEAKPQKICNAEFNIEFNDEKISARNQQNEPLSDEITSINIESNIQSQNFTQNLDKQTSEKSLSDENFPGDLNFSDNSAEIIRYKCLRCDNLFSDLESASIHCTQCTNCTDDDDAEDVDFVERTEGVEYLDESFVERTENSENAEETREEILKSRKKLCDVKLQDNQGSNQSSLTKKKSKLTKTRKSSIVDKRKISEAKSSHSCPNCESIFSSAALLRRHTVVHTGERPFECPTCKKRFSQLGQLNFHKNFHTNPRYRCDICEKPFLRPSDIEKHMRTHTGEKPYECAICEKSFAQLVALRQHERIHTGDKPFVCEICGKRFSQKANKTKHLKIHKEGAKPYTCGICGRSFSELEEMKLHRAGHGGGKPRKCNYCEERFRKMSELSQHTRRFHTFEKPHKCAFCQKAFYSLYNLKQHVMVHTGQKPHSCSRCNLKFTQKGNLTKHFERKHGERASHENNYIVFEENEGCDETKYEMPMINDDLAKSTNESLIIEREETVEVEMIEDHVDQSHSHMYKII